MDPEHVEHVLVRNARNYQLSTAYDVLGEFLGDGLLTSHGEAWKAHRRLAQPAFSSRRLSAVAPVFVDAAAAASDRLLLARTGPVDLAAETARLTLDAVGRTLFGADVADEATLVAPALRVVQEHAIGAVYSPLPPTTRRLVGRLPLPAARRYRRAVLDLDAIVQRVIDDRHRNGGPDEDLLGLLLGGQDGRLPLHHEIRDEVMTFLLAGHETTAAALTWTFGLLSRHPAERRRLHDELDSVLAGRAPTQADLPDLPYLRAVVDESLRLFPRVWMLERRAQAADTIGGFDIPAGSIVVLAPYLTHRHPRSWDDPEGFAPDRWLDPATRTRSRAAYLHFGAGARQCIGGAFAVLGASLMLATLAQRVHLDLEPGVVLSPTPRVTLTAGSGVAVRVRSREQVAASAARRLLPAARTA